MIIIQEVMSNKMSRAATIEDTKSSDSVVGIELHSEMQMYKQLCYWITIAYRGMETVPYIDFSPCFNFGFFPHSQPLQYKQPKIICSFQWIKISLQ